MPQILRPSWAILGPACCYAGASWGYVGPSRALRNRCHIGHPGVILASCGGSWGQLGPTWANMGPTWGPRKAPKSVQGAKNLVPTGSEARNPAKSRHGPQIDPKMDTNGFQMNSKMDPELIPNGAQIDPKSAIAPFQIGSKIDFKINFM